MDELVRSSVSVVVPAFREALGIATAVGIIERAVASATSDYEIVVVDDGSPDHTFAEIEKIAARNEHVRGIRLSRNFGKEAALLAGLREAGGDAVITIDADLQHPPALIPQMIDAWRKGAVVVNAVKRERGGDHFWVRWRADLFNTIIGWLGGIDLRDASDFKLLDRRAVAVIVEMLPEKKRFYRGLANWIGFEQVNLPFDVDERRVGASSWSLRSLLRLALTALVSFTSVPLRIVTVLGLVTLLIGFAIAVDALWSRLHGLAVSGFATLIITLLFIGSSIMISLGIIGEYIAKIYDEIKSRPNYLVSATCGRAAATKAAVRQAPISGSG